MATILLDDEQKIRCQELLDEAARLQHEFWDALGELEDEIGFEITGDDELSGMTVDQLLDARNAAEDEADEEDVPTGAEGGGE